MGRQIELIGDKKKKNAAIFSAIVVVVAAGNSLIAASRHVVTNILIADGGSRAVDRRCVDASVVHASVGSAGISVIATGKTNGLGDSHTPRRSIARCYQTLVIRRAGRRNTRVNTIVVRARVQSASVVVIAQR